jgi:hypothetical protein
MPCQVAESCCQVAGFIGAGRVSRNQVRCSGQEYPLAQKVGFRTSVHRHLELLDAVHGALDRAGVVVQGQPGDHGVQVVLRREASHPNDIWQADHTQLDLMVLNEDGAPTRAWLTVILNRTYVPDYKPGIHAVDLRQWGLKHGKPGTGLCRSGLSVSLGR